MLCGKLQFLEQEFTADHRVSMGILGTHHWLGEAACEDARKSHKLAC